jgi:histidinol-phosphate aminotransferase
MTTGSTTYYMNRWVCQNDSLDYSRTISPVTGIELDCTLGVNPNDYPQSLYDKLHEFHKPAGEGDGHYQDIIKYYPHDETICQSIADRLKRLLADADVSDGLFYPEGVNIVLGCGSLDILNNINLLCLTGGQRVLGHGPQFTVYEDNVVFTGSEYDYYQMVKKSTDVQDHNYRFNADKYIEKMKASAHSLYIVENPNNPTGQIISRLDISKIAEYALATGKILIVDEAYGDYMDISNSAITLLKKYPNIIVVKTFSKGLGMAGMRMGYAVSSSRKDGITDDGLSINEDSILFQLSKLINLFVSNGMARVLAQTIIEAPEDTIEKYLDIAQITRDKKYVLDYIEKSTVFNVATTADNVPIFMIYYDATDEFKAENPEFNLQSHLACCHLGTVSCETYRGLDKYTVRIMLPKSSKIDQLITILEAASAPLPSTR